MSNEATIKARAAIPHQPRLEAAYMANKQEVTLGFDRLACMNGDFKGKQMTYNGQPLNQTKVCLAAMDESAKSRYNYNDPSYIYAPYISMTDYMGLPGTVSVANSLARSINTAILSNPGNTPAKSPISATIDVIDAKGAPAKKTIPIKNGTAVEAGYLMADSYFNAGMLDKLNITPAALTKLSQEQLEQYAQACYTNTPDLPYGVCINVGAEYGARSIPRVKAAVDAVTPRASNGR